MSYTARILSSLLPLVLLAVSTAARGAVSHLYGGTQVISGSGYVYAAGAATDPADNLYLAGMFDGHNGTGGITDFDPGPGVQDRTPVGYDAYVSQHGPGGGYTWTVVFTAAAPDYVRIEDIAAAGDGVYITGLFSGTADFGGGAVLHAVGGPNRFVAKLTTGGATAWVRSDGLLETSGTGLAGTVTADDGGVYVTGVITGGGGAVDFDPTAGRDLLEARGSPAAYITRLHADGSYAWTRVLNSTAGAGSSHVVDVRPGLDGGIDVLAAFAGNLVLDPTARHGLVRAATGRCAFHELLTQFMPDGGYANWVWPLSPDYTAFAADAGGNLYLTGPFQQRRQYNPFYCNGPRGGPPVIYARNQGSAVITRLNGDGSYGWTRPFWSMAGDTTGAGIGQYILIDSTGAAYVAGSTPDPATGMVSADPVFLARFSTQGVMSWLRDFGSGSVRGAAIDARNTIYAAGEFQQADAFNPDGAGDVEVPTGYSSVYLSHYYFNPDNSAPVADDGAIATPENITTTGTLSASDRENDALTYVVVDGGQKGIVTITDVASGAFTYLPHHDVNGSDTFTFVANDGQYDSNVGTVTVTIHPPVPGVDLRITALEAPSGAEAGSRIRVFPTLTNAGTANSGRTRIGLYLSPHPNVTTSDLYLGSTYVYRPLYPNASARQLLDVIIPRDMPLGRYYLGAIADDINAVPESNEGNNTLTTPFTVTAPDLAVTAIHVATGALAPGNGARVTVDVKNQGDAEAPANRIVLLLSPDAAIDRRDRLLAASIVPRLAAGAAGSVTMSVRFPRVAPGSYYVGAFADYANTVKESNEANNIGAMPVTVGP